MAVEDRMLWTSRRVVPPRARGHELQTGELGPWGFMLLSEPPRDPPLSRGVITVPLS